MDFRSAAALSAMAVGLALAGCGDGAESPPTAAPAITARAQKLPNIIVLTVDTLRADHLARYGYGRDTMPAMEKFADTAVVFDQAVVPRGSTRPSYASMLTGLYPFRNGVRSNAVVLHSDLLTLPEMVKAAGYHTAAFVSNFVLLGELSNCSQGFDLYDDQLEDREAHRPNFERTAVGTLEAILRWLESGPPEPFLLFTNFIDPHGPYEPPRQFRDMYRSSEQRMLKPHQIPYYQSTPGVRDFYDFLDRYDGEIRFTDEALATLIEELKARGLWDDALVVFTADHGESMGEHSLFFEHHQNLWEATTRVPLMIRLPVGEGGAPASPRRVPGVSSPMDLMPTVADLLGISSEVRFDGESLLPVLRGAKPATERVVFIEFPNATTPNMSHPDVYAVRADGYKMVKALDQETGWVIGETCFDLSRDPHEQLRIPYDPHIELHREMALRLDGMIDQVRRYRLPFEITEYEMPLDERADHIATRRGSPGRRVKELTPEQIESLRRLGYVQ